MPRIPSTADVNPIGASATRLPTVRAEAADFGYAIAQGLASFGKGVGDVGDRLTEEVLAPEEKDGSAQDGKDDSTDSSEKKEVSVGKRYPPRDEISDKEAALAVAALAAQVGKQRAQARERGQVLIDNMKRGTASPGLLAKEVVEEFDRAQAKEIAALPEPQRQAATVALAPVRQGVLVKAQQRAHNLQVEAMAGDAAETLRLLQLQAVREPQAAALYAAEGTAQLRAHLNAGAMTPEQFEVQNERFRRELYAGVVDAQPAAQAMADLENGVYDDALDDPDLKQFLTQQVAWRLLSETAQGAAAAEAQVARLRRGEPVPREVSATTQQILAAGDMANAELQAEVASRVRSELQSLRFAPEAEVERRIDALAPALDAADTAARQQVQQEVWTQSRMMLRERDKDPAAYVMEQPAVAEAFAAAEKNPALLPDAVAARLAAQSAMGMAPEAQNALTLEERARIVDGLRRLEPQQQIAAMLELGRLYGDQAATVASDLAETGLSMEMHLAVDPSGGLEVSGRLAQAGESNGGAQAAEGGVIEEAAEKLISGDHEFSPGVARPSHEGKVAVHTHEVPPLPLRKPERAMPADQTERSAGEADREEFGTAKSSRALTEEAALERYRDLVVGERARELDKRTRSLAFREFVSDLERQADDANASPEMRNLFVKLTLHRMLKDKLGAERARELASAELGLGGAGLRATKQDPVEQLEDAQSSGFQTPDKETTGTPKAGPVSTLAAEKELDSLLLVLGINPILREGDASPVLPLVKEIMQVRAYAASGEYEKIKDLRGRIKALDGTEHRFLYQPLTAKLNRALDRPETVPWALSDGEVYSVFKALGGSTNALRAGGGTLAVLDKFVPPARFLTWALSLAALQQSQMRSLYEAELYRRGIFRKPNAQP